MPKTFLTFILISSIVIGHIPGYCQAAKSKAKKSSSSSSRSTSNNNNELAVLIRAANELFDKKLYNQALEKLKSAETIDPNDGTMLLWFGAVYAELARYDEALEALNRALRYIPKVWYPTAYSWLAKVHRRKGDYAKALEYAKKSINLDQSAVNYFVAGNIYAQMGNYDEAIINFSQAAENTKVYVMEQNFGSYSQAINYERRGYCYYKKGDLERAKADVDKIIELFPRFKKVFASRENALLYYDFDKRMSIANDALTVALKYESSGNYPEAFSQMEKAFYWMPIYDPNNLNTLDPNVTDNLIRIYAKLINKPELPEEARRFFIQAETYTKDKDYNQAVKAYGELINLTPWYPEAWYNTALLKAQQKHYSEAIKDIKKYLELTPRGADSRAVQDKVYEWEALAK